MDLEEKFYCCWPFVMMIIIVIAVVTLRMCRYLCCCCRSYPSSTLCVRVYAADGRSLGASDCRLVCPVVCCHGVLLFWAAAWGERACVPVCVRANRNRRWPLMMMMMIVCLMRCALVGTFSLSVCFSVIAVILLTDTWLLDGRICACACAS